MSQEAEKLVLDLLMQIAEQLNEIRKELIAARRER